MKNSKDIFILAIGQALTGTIVSLLTSISSLAGLSLSPNSSLSTLPVTATILGTFIMIYPASTIMSSFGRRNGFILKSSLGIIGGVICAYSIFTQNFYILLLGAFVMGLFNSFGQYYRFAAIDTTTTEEGKTFAISIVTGSGVIGGILGPYLALNSSAIVTQLPYAGGFIMVIIVSIFLAISQLFLSKDLGKHTLKKGKQVNKVNKVNKVNIITLSDGFIQTSVICAIGFSVMVLIMNAAPISMHHDGFSMKQSSEALQVHFALMYLPAFFIPSIVKYIGLTNLIHVGIITSTIGVLSTAILEQTHFTYLLQLGLAGVSWSFIFNGGTLLLSKTYNTTSKAKAQGLNSLIVYSSNLISSFSAGIILANYNWNILNYMCLPLLFLASLSLVSMRKNRKTLPQETL